MIGWLCQNDGSKEAPPYIKKEKKKEHNRVLCQWSRWCKKTEGIKRQYKRNKIIFS